MKRQSALQQRPESVNDLSKLSDTSDVVVVAWLRERFVTDTACTNIGFSSLVAAAHLSAGQQCLLPHEEDHAGLGAWSMGFPMQQRLLHFAGSAGVYPASTALFPAEPQVSTPNAFCYLVAGASQEELTSVFCVNPNDSQLPNQLEGRSAKGQVRGFGLAEIAKRCGVVFEVNMTPDEFCERYGEGVAEVGVQQARTAFGLEGMDAVLGNQQCARSASRKRPSTSWKINFVRGAPKGRNATVCGTLRQRQDSVLVPLLTRMLPITLPVSALLKVVILGQLAAAMPSTPPVNNYLSSLALPPSFVPTNTTMSTMKTVLSAVKAAAAGCPANETIRRPTLARKAAPSRNVFHSAEKAGLANKEALPGEVQEGEATEVAKESSARRRRVASCWILTWRLPNPCLTYIGRMKRLDVHQARREKLALNVMIWFACGCSIFVIAVLGLLICPTQHVCSTTELAGHSFQNNPDGVLAAVRGEVFDLAKLSQFHLRAAPVAAQKNVSACGGKSIDHVFPVQISAACGGISGNLSPFVSFNPKNNSDPSVLYHDFRSYTNDSRPDWYYEQMITMRYLARVGFVGYSPNEIKNMAHSSRSAGAYNGLICGATDYIKSSGSLPAPNGEVPPGGASGDRDFMRSAAIDIFRFNSGGGDITKQLNKLNIDSATLARQKTCLRNIFTIGKVGSRNSAQCQFATCILLAISIIMISIIGFKFLASTNFGSPRVIRRYEKTIDSLAQLKYGDKRKLLVVICGGMILGSGNDRPAPRIVLDILGADPNLDPEPLSFVSLGEGAKQRNTGKVYSGLYECSGHVVPHLVAAEAGKPNERSRRYSESHLSNLSRSIGVDFVHLQASYQAVSIPLVGMACRIHWTLLEACRRRYEGNVKLLGLHPGVLAHGMLRAVTRALRTSIEELLIVGEFPRGSYFSTCALTRMKTYRGPLPFVTEFLLRENSAKVLSLTDSNAPANGLKLDLSALPPSETIKEFTFSDQWPDSYMFPAIAAALPNLQVLRIRIEVQTSLGSMHTLATNHLSATENLRVFWLYNENRSLFTEEEIDEIILRWDPSVPGILQIRLDPNCVVDRGALPYEWLTSAASVGGG
ncbi:hypothetical protein AAF712_015250 [Marasmius tenuissimus]|uniref:Uncharacterized protein n=1 Tax=Marasmius tenuissimus TaxID=585030 RepID=A0ABR2Z9R2_9AGAR